MIPLENKRAELEYMRLEEYLATNPYYPEITPIKIGFVEALYALDFITFEEYYKLGDEISKEFYKC
jgi:hypothetical protein